MDWFALGTAAVGLLFGYTTKGLLAYREQRDKALVAAARNALRKDPKCLCDHWVNEHEVNGGKCLAVLCEVNIAEFYSTVERRQKPRKCSCIGYIGPDPLASGYWIGDGMKGKTA